MYLGHHWSYRRETGESQMVYNYFRAFTDYIINFTFGRGVQFRSPKQSEAIVPDLLKRVWEVDNDQAAGPLGDGPAGRCLRGLLRQGRLRGGVRGQHRASASRQSPNTAVERIILFS
jgi:hypothetical protein